MSTNDKPRPVSVTDHAVDRFRKRKNDVRGNRAIREEIRDEVRAALAAGRVNNHRPKAFRLYRERRRGKLEPGDRFVWNEDESLGWIVRREPEADTVMTTVVRTVGQDTTRESAVG